MSCKLSNHISPFSQDSFSGTVATFILKSALIWMINYGVILHINFKKVTYNIIYSHDCF